MGRYNCTGASSRGPNSRTSPTTPDDFHEVLAIERNALADGLLILPGAACHGLVHQDDQGRLLGIGIAKRPARDQGNSDGTEIVRRDTANRLHGRHLGIGTVVAEGPETQRPAASDVVGVHREAGGDRDGEDAGKRLDALDQAPCRHALRLIIGIFCEVEVDAHGEHVLRHEARVDALQLDQAVDHEPGANQQHIRKCHLCRNQRAPHEAAAGARGGLRALIFEGRGHVAAGVNRCQRAAQDGGQRGAYDGEAEHPAVHRNLSRSRRQLAGEPDEQSHAAVRESDTDAGGKHGKEQTLGQQLAEQPSGAGPHRGADSEFAFTARHAGQNQVGHVGARDQQNECRRPKQGPQEWPRVVREFFAECQRCDAVAGLFGVRCRILLLQLAGDGPQIGSRLLEGDVRFQSSEDPHHAGSRDWR